MLTFLSCRRNLTFNFVLSVEKSIGLTTLYLTETEAQFLRCRLNMRARIQTFPLLYPNLKINPHFGEKQRKVCFQCYETILGVFHW